MISIIMDVHDAQIGTGLIPRVGLRGISGGIIDAGLLFSQRFKFFDHTGRLICILYRHLIYFLIWKAKKEQKNIKSQDPINPSLIPPVGFFILPGLNPDRQKAC